ncbi:fasciclin domain-containing protein [Draconibacterium sediminis]|uniref:Uncharacterized protein n=1 Tax=Draconibacterium sediminis TaxID=1544798 RepID=A0A0D8J9J2_9BACT|nr:fasciclin domain-containing protein [Draconibacterium sediminis]KJF43572.1 hypothetical protein LH29_10640 [Draconibacterium sediminis]
MKKIRNYFKYAIFFFSATVIFTSCELVGLEFQVPYKYDYEAGTYSNETNMTAWEFIQSRPDLFSVLKEGIEYTGLQSNYEQPDCTYLLLTDAAFSESTSNYFETHSFPDPNDTSVIIIPQTLKLYSQDQVKELLLYHTVKGAWTWSNLPASATWYDTFATADTAKVNMYLLKSRNANIVFNNFEGHYIQELKARTTNLKTSDGSYMHVMDSWLDRPTKLQLR